MASKQADGETVAETNSGTRMSQTASSKTSGYDKLPISNLIEHPTNFKRDLLRLYLPSVSPRSQKDRLVCGEFRGIEDGTAIVSPDIRSVEFRIELDDVEYIEHKSSLWSGGEA